ncbi:MAG TPA: sigma-70 family RNA polymerase sigma factor [Myxococcota bacterium]|nr:sigma-70 family RNA polymerase sigma factor [Myxococcota bacterium]
MSSMTFTSPSTPAATSTTDDGLTFEDLLEGQLDGLYRAALGYTRNATQAEDLTHDTVLRALRYRSGFRMGTNFKAWIYTILTNTFIERYRRRQRERQVLEDVEHHDAETAFWSAPAREAGQDVEESYLQDTLSDDVLAALNTLPDHMRTVVVLREFEDLSYKEIADVLDCPAGTVMSRLFRARRMLEPLLADVAAERGIFRRAA